MKVNKVIIQTNVMRSQIEQNDTDYILRGIPITVNDSVMNGVLYSKTENKKAMPSMIGKPLTIDHPVDSNGNFISALEGKGLKDFFSGGVVTNAYEVDNIWYADAEIKKSILAAQNGGTELQAKLESKSDLGVSTGLFFEDNEISGVNSSGEKYGKSAINMNFNHLATTNNPAGGSATTAVFNSENTVICNVIDVINDNCDNKEISSLRAAYNALKAKLDTFIAKSYNETDLNINVNEKEGSEMTPEEIKAAIAEAVTANAESNKQALVAAVNSAVAPLQEKIATMQESITANADKEKAALVADVVALDIGIDEELAKTMSVNSLNSVIAKNSGKPAGGVTTNGKRGKEEEYDAFAMPEFKVKGAE